MGNTGSMKRKRPELVGVTQVKQHSHRDAIRVPRERCVRRQKKSLETAGVVRDNAQTGQVKCHFISPLTLRDQDLLGAGQRYALKQRALVH